jgi:hypothetical protein
VVVGNSGNSETRKKYPLKFQLKKFHAIFDFYHSLSRYFYWSGQRMLFSCVHRELVKKIVASKRSFGKIFNPSKQTSGKNTTLSMYMITNLMHDV